MKRMLSALALVSVAACSGGGHEGLNPAGPSLSATPAATAAVLAAGKGGGATVAREVTGTLTGRFDFTNLWGDDWWEFYSDSVARGTVTHLGLSELRTRHIPTLELELTAGTFTLLAANGDEISGTYEGSAAYDPDRSDVVHGSATFTVSGGTGRFAGATGSFTATFLEVFDDPTWASAGVTWTLAGSVRY